MKNRIVRFGTAAAAAAMALAIPWAPGVLADSVTFSEDIQPIMNIRCVECHQPGGTGYEKTGLDLTSYQGLMKGTKHGPIVVPGNAFQSNLNVLIEGRAADKVRMPHNKKKLSRCEVDSFRRWVNRGAKDD